MNTILKGFNETWKINQLMTPNTNDVKNFICGIVLSGHKSSHISSEHLLSWEFGSHKGTIKTCISNSADIFYCGQMFLKTITGTNEAQNNIISCTAEHLLICCVQSCIRGTTIPNFCWAIYQSGSYFLERSQTN